MTCRQCFHYDVCGVAAPDSDPSRCKKFVPPSDILTGPALKVVLEDYELQKKRCERLNKELKRIESDHEYLYREVELLRIIKQTLEMQSGMKFNFDI